MITLAVIADTHIGSTVGLCPPTVALDDGGTYHYSTAQAWLWECWMQFWDRMHQLASSNELWVVWNGDILENLHHSTTQLWSMNEADWFKAARDVFQSVRPVARQFILRGTQAHDGIAGQLVEACAPDHVVPDGNNRTWWELTLDIDGVLLEFWHHGSVGRLPWTRSNQLNRLSSEIVVEYFKRTRPVPDLVCVAHNHLYDESSPQTRPLVVSLPAWQLATAWSRKRQAYQRSSIGGFIIQCSDMSYSKSVMLFHAPEAPPVRLPKLT